MEKFIGLMTAVSLTLVTQGCVFKSDYEALMADKTDVDQELKATQLTLNTTRDAVAELEAEVGELKTLFDAAQIQNQELSGQIGNLGNQVQSIKEELGTTESRVSELSALTDKDRERRVSAHQMLQTLNQALTAAQEQFTVVHTQFEASQAAQAKKEKRLQGLDRTRVILAKRVGQLQAENKTLKAQKEEAINLAKQLAEEKAKALGEASNLDGEKSKALERITALEQKHANLENEKERLAQDLAILQADKDVLKADKKALANKSSELENAKSILEAEKDKLAASEQEAKSLIAKLQADISTKDVKISELSGVVKVDLDNSILFRAGSAKLGKSGRKALQEVVEVLKSSPDRVIRVYGHTDATTAPEGAYYKNNWGLSALRAASVVSYLVEQGINPTDVAAVGFGATRPIADNETREGRDMNRRIEIVLVPKLTEP